MQPLSTSVCCTCRRQPMPPAGQNLATAPKYRALKELVDAKQAAVAAPGQLLLLLEIWPRIALARPPSTCQAARSSWRYSAALSSCRPSACRVCQSRHGLEGAGGRQLCGAAGNHVASCRGGLAAGGRRLLDLLAQRSHGRARAPEQRTHRPHLAHPGLRGCHSWSLPGSSPPCCPPPPAHHHPACRAAPTT